MAYNNVPDFEKDYELGKIGEEWAFEALSSSPKSVKVEDASGDYRFRLLDVDLVQYLKTKENGEQYTLDDVFANLMGKGADKSFFNLYEVKTDTVSIRTRNVVYEIISHDGPGCAAISRANYFIYAFINEHREIREVWLIDVKKWREYIRENSNNVRGMGETKNGGIAINNFNKFKDKVMNILTNIEVMEKKKIAKKIQ